MIKTHLTFAMKVKNEIFYNKQYRIKNKYAQGYGLIMFSKSFNKDNVCMITENKGVARLYCDFIYDLTQILGTITLSETRHTDSNTVYTASIDNECDKLSILKKFNNTHSYDINFDSLSNDGDIEAFLSGVYLACGNITDPLKNYQLEFIIYESKMCKSFCELLNILNIKYGISSRRNQNIIYIKESEQIENILAMIGATKTVFEFINVKIYKELRNKVNRQTNCETANIDRTVKASTKQVMAIVNLQNTQSFDSLDDDLKELAILRLDNPEMSLRELGENHSMNLSRSAVNYRLEKIISLSKIKFD